MPGFLEMSDEDFMESGPPAVTQEESAAAMEAAQKVQETELPDPTVEAPAATEVETPATTEATQVVEEVKKDENTEVEKTAEVAPVVEKPEGAATTEADKKTEAAAPSEKTEQEKVETVQEVDYKAEYEKLMSPLKANGKSIELRSPQELIQLAQMGANYTKNMQQLAPHRKLLMMLEKAGITESNVGFLIDVHTKNPDAIKKLVKDSGLDPMDIDLNQESQYKAGNHSVTDAEVVFQETVQNLQSTEEGKTTILRVVNDWDDESKKVLGTNPEVLQTIHEQRINGIYDRIDAEVSRQRTLGMIPANASYLQAYQYVGNQIQARNGFADLVQSVEQAPVQKQPIATSVKKVESPVKHNDAVASAAASRTTPVVAKTATNPLALSDEEFVKHHANLQGRL